MCAGMAVSKNEDVHYLKTMLLMTEVYVYMYCNSVCKLNILLS